MELDALVSTPMLHDSVVTVDVIGGSAGSNSDIDFNIFNHFCRPRGSPSPAQVWGWARLTQCRLRTASSPQSWSHAWAVPQRSATAVVGMDNFDIFGNSGLLGTGEGNCTKTHASAWSGKAGGPRYCNFRSSASRLALQTATSSSATSRLRPAARGRRVQGTTTTTTSLCAECRSPRAGGQPRSTSSRAAGTLPAVPPPQPSQPCAASRPQDLQDRQDGRDREKGQPRLPAPARDVLEYFVHDTWMRSQDDEANYQWAGWASLRKLRIGCSWIEINEAVEAYRDAEEEAYNEAK
mmetsp:Transcript_49542/g.137362  ORF Transcript_49542/g.137362 Transcript_49542/m.137362 type:complete len:294 (-) Transcript_49542:36-917(-)